MSESHVENQIQARIARVRAEEERKRQQRAELSAARAVGIAARHRQKLARQRGAEDHADAEDSLSSTTLGQSPTVQPNRGDIPTVADSPEETPVPAALRTATCPACRTQRTTRLVTVVNISGAPHDVVRCLTASCELMWLVRAERPRTAPRVAA